MKKNKKAISLIIAMWLALIMSLLALYILEYMIPFWKNTKNIEQSVVAYYQADSWIEEALFTNSNNTLDPILVKDYWIEITKKWTQLPPIGQWNSEYDLDYNIIKVGQPIQIEIWEWQINLNNFKIHFRVPDLDRDWNNDNQKLLGWALEIINWQLSSNNDVLNADWNQITADDIPFDNTIWDKAWINLSDSWATISEFYSWWTNSNWVVSQCWSTGSGCILKMSVINKLETTDNVNVPYLEWKIETWTSNKIPLRYKIVNTTWKSYDFQKELRVRVPQQTLNEAFDFALFQ